MSFTSLPGMVRYHCPGCFVKYQLPAHVTHPQCGTRGHPALKAGPGDEEILPPKGEPTNQVANPKPSW